MAYQKIVLKKKLQEGEKIRIEIGKVSVLLFKMDERFYAYEDKCPHLQVSLAKGSIEGTILTCSAHEWSFDLCSGRGVNPGKARLKAFPLLIENGELSVDVSGADTAEPADLGSQEEDWVGPVLQAGALADAVIAAIRSLNQPVRLIDRGAYVRVLVPLKCRLTQKSIEEHTKETFRFPGALEEIMPSFKGRLTILEGELFWHLEPKA